MGVKERKGRLEREARAWEGKGRSTQCKSRAWEGNGAPCAGPSLGIPPRRKGRGARRGILHLGRKGRGARRGNPARGKEAPAIGLHEALGMGSPVLAAGASVKWAPCARCACH